MSEGREKHGLSNEQLEHIQLYLQNRNVAPDCPLCKQNRWDGAVITDAPIVDLDGNPTGKSLRLVAINCGNCAHVVTFNAFDIGLFGGPLE
jgi:hypothetical protein